VRAVLAATACTALAAEARASAASAAAHSCATSSGLRSGQTPSPAAAMGDGKQHTHGVAFDVFKLHKISAQKNFKCRAMCRATLRPSQ
jgi:hypothetical protein